MHYLIARDGQQMGQFSEEEVRAGLFEGRYLSTDVAWTEGMADWKPLGEIFGQGNTRVAGPRTAAGPSATAGWSAPTQTAGLAITALVLGILSVLTCGGLGVAAIATIICGHLALSNIAKSGGTLGGRGMALSGLIMGYASIVLFGVAILSSLSMSAVSRMAERGEIVKGIGHCRVVASALREFANDSQGKFPETLEVLVEKGHVTQEKLNLLQSFKPVTWQGEPGFDYFGASMTDATPGAETVLLSRSQGADGKRVVVYKDTSAEVRKMPLPGQNP